jgi:hypothetical protein
MCASNVVMGWTKAYWVTPWLPTLAVASTRGVKIATLYSEKAAICTFEDGRNLSKITDIPTASFKKITTFQMHGSTAVAQALSVLVEPEAPVCFPIPFLFSITHARH